MSRLCRLAVVDEDAEHLAFEPLVHSGKGSPRVDLMFRTGNECALMERLLRVGDAPQHEEIICRLLKVALFGTQSSHDYLGFERLEEEVVGSFKVGNKKSTKKGKELMKKLTVIFALRWIHSL